ncbi:mechanosensitive ion channel [Candidatus Woesearchaeota archaeon]|nr:mechanosensitive ion channel [Candidatus Woesearchaeota archaeon]
MKTSYWITGLVIILLGLIFGCYAWLACKDYCISILIGNYSAIMLIAQVYIKKIATIILLFILFKIIQSIILGKILKKIMKQLNSAEKYTRLQKLINFSLWTVFVIITLSIFIGNITALLASLGLIGFGLTFALQKPILNFVGWLTIIMKNIYSEGDRIKINGIVGDVKEIQVMNTMLDGLLENSDVVSGKIISFPNELALTSDISNYTKESNYIVNELSISITYESDYHKAIKLLKEIILKQVTKNKRKYIKKITKQKKDLNGFINKWIKTNKPAKKEEKTENQELERLKKETEQLTQELKQIEEEFIPNIRIEMLDSAIQLIAQFTCPYDEIKKNRTEINILFLDAIQNEKNIEVAYPHMEIITKNNSKDKSKK